MEMVISKAVCTDFKIFKGFVHEILMGSVVRENLVFVYCINDKMGCFQIAQNTVHFFPLGVKLSFCLYLMTFSNNS